VSNVLNEEKKQQVIALGRLGWSSRRIERTTGVRRETAAAYLKVAGYDGAGRISSVAGTPPVGNSTTYLSNTSYWPHGAFKSFTFGNQMQRSYTFNKQLQVKEITDTSASSSQLLDLKYYYGGAAGPLRMAQRLRRANTWLGWAWRYQKCDRYPSLL
jgi:hypothetical protein